MALINTTTPEAATGEVADIYATMVKTIGSVPTPFQLLGTSPTLLRQQADNLGYYFTHPTLSFATLATIRMLVSVDTDCHYCIDRNAGFLIDMAGWTVDQVAAAKKNVDDSPLAERERAMVKLAVRAAKTPKAITQADIDAVRAHGWSDADILDGVNHAARMVAGDIIIDTFKVERDF
jgi:uncharacterized peroxidase-related enzyme